MLPSKRGILVLVLLKDIHFIETFRKYRYAGLLGDSLTLKNLSTSYFLKVPV